MKLKKAQKEAVLIWIAEGLESDEINNALTTGFALKENRVQALQSLAKKMLEELTRDQDNRLWTTNAKGIGSGDDFERYDYEEFNKAELDSLRGVLDDIASEIGERVRKTDLTSGGKPLPRPGIDPKQLKNLSNDELIALETAAEILERSGADQDPAIKS
jgi:hypothetical protein